MNSILAYSDYRPFIRDWSKANRRPFKELAGTIGVHTSYFSRVMGADAHFSPEQIFLLGHAMGLIDWQMKYFELLGEIGASGHIGHQSAKRAQLEELRNSLRKVSDEFGGEQERFMASTDNIELYYSEALTAKIHMYLTIESFRNNEALLIKELGISQKKFSSELQKLEALNIICRKEGVIRVLVDSIHLDAHSAAAITNHINWRLEAVHRIGQRELNPSDYHFSVVFSVDRSAKLKIKELFKDFVVAAQKIVAEVPKTDQVCSMTFDLY